MPRNADSRALAGKLDDISSVAKPVDMDGIASVVESVMKTLSGDVSLAEFGLYHELESLADYIQSAKREIAAIRPDDIRSHDIPMATDELDAVVGATAEATGAILDAAETLERLADAIPGDGGEKIRTIATSIYEACNFQDITGQRITKVVRTLKHIEGKIDALLSAFGELKTTSPPPEIQSTNDDSRVLNGPQLPGDANKQDEIDAIFANLK